MSDAGLLCRFDAGILRVTIDRPAKGNSFTREMQAALVAAFADASASSEVRAVLLTATGDRHFCTGPDLGDANLAPSTERRAGEAARILRTGSQTVVAAMLDCEKPIVCALNGLAAGGGANLVLASDLVVAAEHARIAELFVRRGLAPDGGAAYLLAQRVPLNVAKQLLFLGGELSAADAHRLGLVYDVVAASELAAVADELAGALAAGPTRAIAAAKSMLHQAFDADRATAFASEALLVEQVAGTDDVGEGIASFRERREPRFEGR